MEWLLSPTNYMVELVPGKQNGANGRTLEVPLFQIQMQKKRGLTIDTYS